MRPFVGLILAITCLAAIVPATGAQDNTQASITIYSALCPPGVDPDQLYEACYDTPGAAIDYILTDPNLDMQVTTSGPSGLAAFEGLTLTGQYALQAQYPSNLLAVQCSEDGAPFPFTYSEIVNQILLDLTPANDIRCDIYLPAEEPGSATAQLTIHNRVCPVAYAGSDYFATCHAIPAPGQVFFLENTTARQGTTDAAGDVTFTDLAPDAYVVFGGPPGDFIAHTAIYCARTVTPGTPFPFAQEDGEARFTLTLAAGDDVVCDVYSVPADQRGQTPTPAVTPAPTRTPPPTVPALTLPNTGVGSSRGGNEPSGWLAVALVLIVIASAGCVAGGRRAASSATHVQR